MVTGTPRMLPDFQCIEGRFQLVPKWPVRRWKAALRDVMTHNAGIFHWKNHWIGPVTRSVSRNPCTEIRKAASAENDIDPREYQENGHIPVFCRKAEKRQQIIPSWHCICSVCWYCEDNDHHTRVVAGRRVVPIHWPDGLQTAVFCDGGDTGKINQYF